MVHLHGASRWRQQVEWAAQVRKDYDSRSFERDALVGEAQPGKAWDAYRVALDAAAAVRAEHGEAANLAPARIAKLTNEQRRQALVPFEPALAALREGVRRRDARFPLRWDDPIEGQLDNLLVARDLVNAAVVRADLMLVDGRDADAVDLLLDGAVFGADFMRSPLLIQQMIGLALVVISTEEAWDEARIAQLDAVEMVRLRDGLVELDQRVESCLSEGSLDTALMVQRLQQPVHHQAFVGELGVFGSWRYGFSFDLMAAECIAELRAAEDDLRRQTTLDWPARQVLANQLHERMVATGNPMLRVSAMNLAAIETSLRTGLARLRLLRAELMWRCSGEVSTLPDPTGSADLVAELRDDVLHLTAAADPSRLRRVAHP